MPNLEVLGASLADLAAAEEIEEINRCAADIYRLFRAQPGFVPLKGFAIQGAYKTDEGTTHHVGYDDETHDGTPGMWIRPDEYYVSSRAGHSSAGHTLWLSRPPFSEEGPKRYEVVLSTLAIAEEDEIDPVIKQARVAGLAEFREAHRRRIQMRELARIA